MNWKWWTACIVVACSALSPGCDDGSSEDAEPDMRSAEPDMQPAEPDMQPAEPDMQPSPGGGIRLSVRYTGEATGALVAAVFETFPPQGPPLGFQRVPEPTFPAALDFPDVPDGDHAVLVFLDAPPENPMAPSPADPQAVVEVSAPTAAPVDVELVPGEPVDPPDARFEVVVGEGIGPVRLGMTYAEMIAALGEEPAGFGADGAVLLNLPAPSLQIVLASPEAGGPAPDAVVIAVQANAEAGFFGAVRPGVDRAAVEAELGAPSLTVEPFAFYPDGAAITYADDTVAAVSIWAPYVEMPTAPEMQPPAGRTGGERPVIDPATIGQVDMHLHFGRPGQVPQSAARFTTQVLPPFLQPYRPGITATTLDPYFPHLGIRGQTERAGSRHAVLFAVYTQESAGYATNRQLEAALTDPANAGPDGRPWAWGLASIDFYNGYVRPDGTLDEAVAEARLDALGAYFEAHPSLFVGIKLAHAHQGVAFDDARFLGVYDVAAAHDVPLYLHTGMTPFPGATNEVPFYDPAGLDGVISSYPAVRFVLGHVGQGDPRSVENALRLAAEYANVYLEISALGRPLLVDDEGEPLPDPEQGEDQLPSVMAAILDRGLVDKAIFGSDGPQGPGAVSRYTMRVRETMETLGYDAEQQAAVMGGNFARVFFPPAR